MRDAPEYRREQNLERKKLEVNIFRYDPQSGVEPHYDNVVVEGDIPSTVLLLLYKIQREYLPDMALSHWCNGGQCGSCTLKINGINRHACSTQVEGDSITIEPPDNCSIIRDLKVF
jgi:succinate dehydrogenase / fumarate reductase iron-sulfur subunit